MAVTISSADKALKSYYLEVMADQLNYSVNPFLAKVKQTSDDVWGKEIRKLAIYGLNGGIGAGTEDGDLPEAAGNQYENFVLSLKNLYGSVEISDKAVRAAEPFVYENGGMSLCRDGFHMSLVYGRYLLGAVWYETLTGQSVLDNGYVPCAPLAPEGAAVDDKVLDVLRGAAHKICIC